MEDNKFKSKESLLRLRTFTKVLLACQSWPPFRPLTNTETWLLRHITPNCNRSCKNSSWWSSKKSRDSKWCWNNNRKRRKRLLLPRRPKRRKKQSKKLRKSKSVKKKKLLPRLSSSNNNKNLLKWTSQLLQIWLSREWLKTSISRIRCMNSSQRDSIWVSSLPRRTRSTSTARITRTTWQRFSLLSSNSNLLVILRCSSKWMVTWCNSRWTPCSNPQWAFQCLTRWCRCLLKCTLACLKCRQISWVLPRWIRSVCLCFLSRARCQTIWWVACRWTKCRCKVQANNSCLLTKLKLACNNSKQLPRMNNLCRAKMRSTRDHFRRSLLNLRRSKCSITLRSIREAKDHQMLRICKRSLSSLAWPHSVSCLSPTCSLSSWWILGCSRACSQAWASTVSSWCLLKWSLLTRWWCISNINKWTLKLMHRTRLLLKRTTRRWLSPLTTCNSSTSCHPNNNTSNRWMLWPCRQWTRCLTCLWWTPWCSHRWIPWWWTLSRCLLSSGSKWMLNRIRWHQTMLFRVSLTWRIISKVRCQPLLLKLVRPRTNNSKLTKMLLIQFLKRLRLRFRISQLPNIRRRIKRARPNCLNSCSVKSHRASNRSRWWRLWDRRPQCQCLWAWHRWTTSTDWQTVKLANIII